MRNENTMTVEDLIEALQGFPRDAEVYLKGDSYMNTIELIDKSTVILSDNGIHDSITVGTFTTNYEQVASLFDYDHDVSGLLEDD